MPDRASEDIASPRDVASAVARTARSYDALPYNSVPFPLTQPARLAAIAGLFALDAAPIGEARVLEIGCAAGGNIIPLAARHPGAEFVGVDISEVQVAAGQTRIASLGLSNLELTCRSFTDLGEGDGPFDYIICHGVYSWVAAPLRDALLRVCRERCSPRGLALVSYNVLPGWRPLQVVRDCLLVRAGPDDPRARVKQSREMLDFLLKTSPDKDAYRAALEVCARRIGKATDDYVFHEFLSETNDPCTFRDFIAAASRHELGYLADVELPSMLPMNLPAEAARGIDALAKNDLLATEQLMDMTTGRSFRHSVLVSHERVATANRHLINERLETMHFIGIPDLSIARDSSGKGMVTNAVGTKVVFGEAPLYDPLNRFLSAFPGSSSIDDLVAALPSESRDARGRASVREVMLRMVLAGLAFPSTEPLPAAASVEEKPVVWALARGDAARRADATANLRHEPVALDDVSRQVLPLLDGSRDVDQVSFEILRSVRSGEVVLSRGGEAIHDPGQQAAIAKDRITALLSELARNALLCR